MKLTTAGMQSRDRSCFCSWYRSKLTSKENLQTHARRETNDEVPVGIYVDGGAAQFRK